MTPSEQFARILLTKARDDLAAATDLAANDSMSDDIVGFHCQQAVEKAFKAVLAENDVDFPRTHDLAELNALLRDSGIAGPLTAADLGDLNPWAVELRYDVPSEERLDRPQFIGLAEVALAWAVENVGD